MRNHPQDHPAQAAVNAIMADENVAPDFRRAIDDPVARAFAICEAIDTTFRVLQALYETVAEEHSRLATQEGAK